MCFFLARTMDSSNNTFIYLLNCITHLEQFQNDFILASTENKPTEKSSGFVCNFLHVPLPHYNLWIYVKYCIHIFLGLGLPFFILLLCCYTIHLKSNWANFFQFVLHFIFVQMPLSPKFLLPHSLYRQPTSWFSGLSYLRSFPFFLI